MDLSKATLSNSVSEINSASSLQLYSSKSVDARKVTNNSCEDSGYHSLRNAANSDIYVSNATYEQHSENTNHRVIAMQSSDDKENFQQHLISTHQGHPLATRPPVCSSSLHYVHPSSFANAHDVKQSNLDGNANHIHMNTEAFYDPRCVSLCKGGDVCNLCPRGTSLYPSSVVTTCKSENQISCHNSMCNCKKMDHHSSSSVSSYIRESVSHSDSDFKSETSDLAEKIEFCLLFGYTVNQIQLAISKLGYKVSKNDILAELSSMQNNARTSSVSDLPTADASEIIPVESSDRRHDLLTRGADPGVDSDLNAHLNPSHVIIDEEKELEEDVKDPGDDSKNLRPIVIDGSNVAMSHGNKQYFSCKGILLAVNFFRNRNHTDITVFVPKYRKEASRHDTPIKDREILTELEKERILVFTPSRNINGKRVTCYDDRFILKLAQETNAVIVSNDNFRDLQSERPEWKTVVEKRLLMYSFVNDRFMPPDDPLGRNGPNIDNFLRIRPASEEQNKPQCPYGKKCTYGKKCKYFHPECPRPASESIVGKKTDNNRKTSKFSLALAADLIQRTEQYYHVPSTTPNSSNHQSTSMENVSPALLYQRAHNRVDISAHQQRITSRGEAQSTGHKTANGECIHGVVPPHISSMQDVSSPQLFPADKLSEQLRQISLSNHGMAAHQHSKMHMGCDPHSLMSSKQRLPGGHGPHPEAGPPGFHADHHIAKRSFQRSSPANLQQGHATRSSGTPLGQQQWNVGSPYLTNPHMPAKFSLPPAYALYQSRVVDPHHASNQSQPAVSQPVLRSYPMPPHSQGPPPVHPHYMGTPFYVAPVNVSNGSNNSLSRSFPHIPSTEQVVESFFSQNYGSTSSHSDSHVYFRSNASAAAHQPGTPHEIASPNHSRRQHLPSTEPPLSSEKNPRYYLYRNLCGLFQRPVVEAVMMAHPDVKEPKKIISLIQQMIID